jgi:hypothetical protein
MKLPRPPRPSPRRLSVALTVLGTLAGLAFLLLPMEATLDDDPLLRLVPFSPALGQTVARVDCGAPVSNFGRSSAKRAATAVAAMAVIGLLGLITLAGARNHQQPAVA